MDIRLTFLGAAGNVTGSRYLVEAGGRRVYVDCGLFQEWRFKARNWQPDPVAPADIDAVVLTHGHLDHCGLLPKLVRDGFAGRVHCTAATADIAMIVMEDAGTIQEEDARNKRKRHAREGRRGPHPEEPLFTRRDALAVRKRLAKAPLGEPVRLAPGIEAEFTGAGHILGAASVILRLGEPGAQRTLVFSGDLGPWDMPILEDPQPPAGADYLVIESTYGDRDHDPPREVPEALARVVRETVAAGGNLVIPSFSVERTQDLLYHLNLLHGQGRVPDLPVFVDSPMAIKVTEVFARHPELFDEEARVLLREGRHLSDFPGLRLCRTREESQAINFRKGPAIIVAGSGMCTSGRIKYHLEHNLGRPESTVLFIGYQASGTLGRDILDGAPAVRLFGAMRPVRARVAEIHGFSAHAGRGELLRWAGALREKPRHVFVTHGEPETAAAFAESLRRECGYEASVPAYLDAVTLT
ncbi:MAG: MBL fold metallo-hydrolase [bacterium]|nr:MBL fold metallo-hydrolase [bacterium]